jgi:hypothetical protein
MLPRVTYSRDPKGIRAEEPQISRQTSFPIRELHDGSHLLLYGGSLRSLQNRMPQSVTITEVPLSKRETEKPERFQVTLTSGGMPPLEHRLPSNPF